MDNQNYSSSDKLAIALACGSVVVAIALYLAEKTPIVVAALVLAMVGLSIYPIFHFVRSIVLRALATLAIFLIGGVFGWQALRHEKEKEAATPPAPAVRADNTPVQPLQQKPPNPTPAPANKPKKTTIRPKISAKVSEQPKGDSSTSIGGISQGPGSRYR